MSDKILVVDDTDTMRKFYDVLLRGQGYRVASARDGEEALEKVESESPDLVLMDLMMPKMDGIEACRRIKSGEETRDIKVVMVTSRGEYSRITEAFAAGCDDYVVKPVDRTELMLKVKELLKFSHLRRMLRAGA